MAIEDDAKRVPPAGIMLGEPLDALSVDDLAGRIALLRAEIERVEKVRSDKLASRDAADTFFRR